MGKSIPIPSPQPQILHHQFGRVEASSRNKPQLRPVCKTRPISSSSPDTVTISSRQMDAAAQSSERQPLADVVADCVKRWFQDALKEAKSGDTAMQVLVGQMYYSGYGVVRDAQKGRAWISRAARSRSSAWKVGDKHPGYNASDSDSDDTKEDPK